MTNKNDDRKSKREKLRSFENWPQLAHLTQTILEEKKVWNVVDESCTDPTIAA